VETLRFVSALLFAPRGPGPGMVQALGTLVQVI
jgi:hypothetical protein